MVIDRGAWHAAVHGVAESDTTEQLDKVFISLRRLSLVVVHGGYSLL